MMFEAPGDCRGCEHLDQEALATVQADPRLSLRSRTDELVDEAVELAAHLRLRAGDAIHVALARMTGTRLVTWDREQRERAAAVVQVSAPSDDPGGSE